MQTFGMVRTPRQLLRISGGFRRTPEETDGFQLAISCLSPGYFKHKMLRIFNSMRKTDEESFRGQSALQRQ